jgi:hypothetical protein
MARDKFRRVDVGFGAPGSESSRSQADSNRRLRCRFRARRRAGSCPWPNELSREMNRVGLSCCSAYRATAKFVKRTPPEVAMAISLPNIWGIHMIFVPTASASPEAGRTYESGRCDCHFLIDFSLFFSYLTILAPLKDMARRHIASWERGRCPRAGLQPAPGRFGHHVSRHYDRGGRCIPGLGQAKAGNARADRVPGSLA